MPDTITLAHSPDSDDAFMFYGLATHKLDTGGLHFEHLLKDIQTLNEEAMRGTYDVTAISFHAYAYIHEKYALLPHGASIGDNYGPIVVSREPATAADIPNLKIAIPGKLTSAFLALRIFNSDFRYEVVQFDKIIEAVQHGLPLPMGGNAIRRDLGENRVKEVSKLLRESINYSLTHRDDALQYAMQFARDMDPALADRFVAMWVNELTLDYTERGREAVRLLLDEGYKKSIIPNRVRVDFVDG